jgi:hypothetical protein
MAGPTNIIGYETISKNMAAKDPSRGVILLVLAISTRAAHETIPHVCLGHIQKIMQAINELVGMSVSIVHPLPVHLHYCIM